MGTCGFCNGQLAFNSFKSIIKVRVLDKELRGHRYISITHSDYHLSQSFMKLWQLMTSVGLFYNAIHTWLMLNTVALLQIIAYKWSRKVSCETQCWAFVPRSSVVRLPVGIDQVSG